MLEMRPASAPAGRIVPALHSPAGHVVGAAATGADLIVWNHEKLDKQHIDLIHQLSKRAWVYTVDDPDRVRWLLEAGIDGIITNRPAEMLRVRNAERAVRNDG